MMAEDQCRRGEIVVSSFRPPISVATDDRSLHEMSSINATVTEQPVVNLVLLPRIEFTVGNKFHFDAEVRNSVNCVLKTEAGLAVRSTRQTKERCLLIFACATRNILYADNGKRALSNIIC